MTQNLILIVAIIIGGGIGFYIGMMFKSLKGNVINSTFKERENQLNETIAQLRQTNSKLELSIETIREDKESLNTQLAKKSSDFENLLSQTETKDKEIEKQQIQIRKDFELLATKILEEKSEKFTLQNRENISNILNPLQEKIKGFEKKVEDSQKESISMHSALKEQLLGLKDLNQQMTKEATNLTRALKGDSKLQGNWGELVLERVLEKSGLEKDREYFVQKSFTRDDGTRVLPDVVLYLPDNKKMIIDSKVSITDYNRYVNAEGDEQIAYLKAHVNSIKRHVEQLSEKNYQDLYDIESPDFVLMFIPIEPAFAVALNQDNTLYNKAFERNIVIVTPTTLLATLRTIDSMWNNEKQQRNAIEIARQAGALYDKFEGLVKDLTNVGRKIDAAKTDYSSAMNKLTEGRGNLITSVEKLKKMGAKAKKSLPDSILKRADSEDE